MLDVFVCVIDLPPDLRYDLVCHNLTMANTLRFKSWIQPRVMDESVYKFKRVDSHPCD